MAPTTHSTTKYIDFQKLCLADTTSSIYDLPTDPPVPNLTDKEIYLFTILFAILEPRFLMYLDKSDEIRAEQWKGWEGWIKALCSNRRFKKAWRDHGSTFDERFEAFVNRLV